MRGWLAGLVMVAVMVIAPTANADEDYAQARKAEFDKWQAEHTQNQAKLADMMARSAAMVAADANSSSSKYSDLAARSKSQSSAQISKAAGIFLTAHNLYKAGNFASAEIALRDGLEIDPGNDIAHYLLSEALRNQGAYYEAALEMDKAAVLAPPGTTTRSMALEALEGLPDLVPPTKIFQVTNPPMEVWDCPDCPHMVVIPAGRFAMGRIEDNNAAPGHPVTIGRPFAVGMTHVTRGEYAAFMRETRASAGDSCYGNDSGWKSIPGLNWQSPGFAQTERDPVVCVSWQDAQAYLAWLNGKVGGSRYHLLTEAEWEYAARAGSTTRYWWGSAIGSDNANCDGCGSQWDNKQTSPAGNFRPNPFGLYDMLGNASHAVEDCYRNSYSSASSDGGAVGGEDSCRRVNKGGSWFLKPMHLESASRSWLNPGDRKSTQGFRLARTL